MSSLVGFLALALTAGAARTPATTRSAGSCLTAPDTVAFLVAEAKWLVRYTQGDSVELARIGLLPVDTSDVEIVAADSVCLAAIAAFNQEKPGAGLTQAYVVQVGSQRYMIWDMRDPTAHWRELMVFDQNWTLKARMAG